ncbi:MAG: agmatinase [Planctomycetes bacterium]|nr:agmatinase [Planctomycetota bacterium]
MTTRKTIIADPRQFPRFAGVATFCRYPLIELVPQENRPVDWAIYGFPFDAGVTYRPGARFGPRAIREASQYVKPYHIEHDLDVTELLSLADAGDAPVRPFSCKETLDATVEFAAGLGDAAVTKLLGVGGDHSLAYAGLKSTWQRRGRPSGGLAMIHFDSHVDTVDETGGERYSHASPFIRAVEEGFLDPKRMLSIGIKGPLNTRRDLDYAKQNGVEILTCERWRREGKAWIRAFLDRLGSDDVYLTFDIDCIDPAYAPGTGTPSIGGFTSAEALAMIRSLRGINLVGADVVEVLPDRDPAGITALLAAHIMFEIICLDAVKRR